MCAEVNKAICLEGVKCMLGVGFGEVCLWRESQSSHDPLLGAPPWVRVRGVFPAELPWMLTNLQVVM